MSKQSEAKEAQGYEAKPLPHVCMTCANYRSDLVEKPAAFSWGKPYTEEQNKRCALGGFAVKKTASCNEWAHRRPRHDSEV